VAGGPPGHARVEAITPPAKMAVPTTVLAFVAGHLSPTAMHRESYASMAA
jgi:hypothetical protein